MLQDTSSAEKMPHPRKPLETFREKTSHVIKYTMTSGQVFWGDKRGQVQPSFHPVPERFSLPLNLPVVEGRVLGEGLCGPTSIG